MALVIHYFTGTGNTFVQAQALARELRSQGEQGRIVLSPMTALFRGNMEDFRDIPVHCLAFPVYMWGYPLIVRDFAQRYRFPEGAYVFALATCGGMAAGTLPLLDKLMRQTCNRGLDSGFAVVMPGNYTPFYGAWAEEKQQSAFTQADARLHSMAAVVRERRALPVESGWAIQNFLMTGLVYRFSSPRIPSMASKLKADQNCTGCGLCEKVCPADNIGMEQDRPVFGNHCQHCLACLHWCPVQSLQFGSSTTGKKRYRHPRMKVDVMMDQKNGKITEIE